eukprot:211735-Pleurochrysis_carterae.AAC.1
MPNGAYAACRIQNHNITATVDDVPRCKKVRMPFSLCSKPQAGTGLALGLGWSAANIWLPTTEQTDTEQPLQGRARSEAVVETDSFGPRTPELACSYNLILYAGSLPKRFRPGGREPTIIHKIQPSGGWELARGRRLGRAYAVVPGRWLEGPAAAITSEFSRA